MSLRVSSLQVHEFTSSQVHELENSLNVYGFTGLRVEFWSLGGYKLRVRNFELGGALVRSFRS
jgi:hypothetical protein